jgi:redox-sensitive bicupin YhaK (pirin superfamily)
VEGNVTVNDQKVLENQLVVFGNDGAEIQVSSIDSSVVLVLSGEPINEAIYPYGPFLMNNKQEIIQAYQDLEDGKFGYLE